MAISPQQLTMSLYSAHRAVIFAIAQLSCKDLQTDNVLDEVTARSGTSFYGVALYISCFNCSQNKVCNACMEWINSSLPTFSDRLMGFKACSPIRLRFPTEFLVALRILLGNSLHSLWSAGKTFSDSLVPVS